MKVWESVDREMLVCGAAGTGKSRCILEFLFFVAEQFPKCRILMCRATRKSMTDSTLVTFEEKVVPPDHYILKSTDVKRENRHSYVFANGSEIVLLGLDEPTRLLSSEYDIIYVPEATEIERTAWETAKSRLRNNKIVLPTGKPVHRMIADCNPADPSHWLYQRCLMGTCVLVTTTHEDNPMLYDEEAQDWTVAGLDYLATLDELTGVEKERLRYGRWIRNPGAIFETFDASVHVLPPDYEVKDSWPVWIGLDFGDVHTAAVVASERPDGALVVWGDYLDGHCAVEDHNRVIWDMIGDLTLAGAYGGSWTEDDWRDDFHLEGLSISKPPIRSVELKISKLKDALSRHKIFFAPRAYNRQKRLTKYESVQHEVTAYTRVLLPDGTFHPELIKDKNSFHSLDALMSLVCAIDPGANTASLLIPPQLFSEKRGTMLSHLARPELSVLYRSYGAVPKEDRIDEESFTATGGFVDGVFYVLSVDSCGEDSSEVARTVADRYLKDPRPIVTTMFDQAAKLPVFKQAAQYAGMRFKEVPYSPDVWSMASGWVGLLRSQEMALVGPRPGNDDWRPKFIEQCKFFRNRPDDKTGMIAAVAALYAASYRHVQRTRAEKDAVPVGSYAYYRGDRFQDQ